MLTTRKRRLTTGLSVAIIASLATAVFMSPVMAAPHPAKAEQLVEQKATRETAKSERAARRADKKAELDAAKADRAQLREARKAALEQRKVDARTLREEARAAISALRDGFSAMSVEERQATLDEIRGVREGYQDLFLLLMESWHAERDELLPNTLTSETEATGADTESAADEDLDDDGVPAADDTESELDDDPEAD